MRSTCHFPANGCCRSGGHRPCRASRTTAENRQRIPHDSSDGEIGSGGASYLGRGSSPRQAFLARRFGAEEAVSILTGLHCKTKLHSTEADSIPTSQCKRNVVSVAGEVLKGKTSNSEDATDNQKEKQVKQVLSHARQVARSKKQGVRMAFRTKLDGAATRNTAGESTRHVGYLTT
jgi:hypothetical protein